MTTLKAPFCLTTAKSSEPLARFEKLEYALEIAQLMAKEQKAEYHVHDISTARVIARVYADGRREFSDRG
jgi:hypothetical protein